MVSDGVKKVAVHLTDRRIKGVAKAGCARRHRAPLTSTNICRHTAAIVAAQVFTTSTRPKYAPSARTRTAPKPP